MSEEFQEKTERATPRKLQKAKEKGQVARSQDLTTMSVMGGILLILYFGSGYLGRSMAEMSAGIFSMQYGTEPYDVARMAVIEGAKITLPFFLVAVVIAIAVSVAQGGFVVKPMQFEINKLNPVEGLKKLFSLKGLTEFLKSILKFLIGGWVVYFIMKRDIKVFPSLSALKFGELVKESGRLIFEAMAISFLFYMIVAFMSYLLEKWQHARSLRMTKQEVKEEHKELEGDPLIKSRVRSLQREAARKRMMQEVPNATVVITNPTHLAVALKYEDDGMPAPRVVAKGAGVVAEKIRKIARENNVPVIEDKPLARSLFKLELDSFIPEELYVAVARILAYIFKSRGQG
jgi:flagellar biosynthetic protein FlhB